jgi:hypothetical protein
MLNRTTLLIGNADIVRFIKSRRIAWFSHVMRMDDKGTPKRILQWKPTGTRTRGRPRNRWIAGIEEDLQIMGVRRWRKQREEREVRKKITEKAKTHSGLSFHLAVCLTTGPKSLPKRALHIVRSRASSFK